MADKPVIYLNFVESTTTGGDYCIKLLRRSKAESDGKDQENKAVDEVVGELYMTFPTAVHLWQTLDRDVRSYIEKLADTLKLDDATLLSRLRNGKDVPVYFLDSLRFLLND